MTSSEDSDVVRRLEDLKREHPEALKLLVPSLASDEMGDSTWGEVLAFSIEMAEKGNVYADLFCKAVQDIAPDLSPEALRKCISLVQTLSELSVFEYSSEHD